MTQASAAPAIEAVPSPDERPELRLIHHMARSGGTLISKCLGCMPKVALLSEIHPLGTRQFNPIAQAHRWFGLLTPEDLATLARAKEIDFADAILMIERRAAERGRRLVIRDWSHLDFTGVPFVAEPAYRLLTAEALARRFTLRQVCTVRHPIDQWRSLSRLAVIRGRLSIEQYLLGYRRFTETAVRIGFFRYEDLTREPAAVLSRICAHLELAFDPGFAERWHAYDRITGDVKGDRDGREIRPARRRAVEPVLLETFAANQDYQASLRLLGYDHPA